MLYVDIKVIKLMSKDSLLFNIYIVINNYIVQGVWVVSIFQYLQILIGNRIRVRDYGGVNFNELIMFFWSFEFKEILRLFLQRNFMIDQ